MTTLSSSNMQLSSDNLSDLSSRLVPLASILARRYDSTASMEIEQNSDNLIYFIFNRNHPHVLAYLCT